MDIKQIAILTECGKSYQVSMRNKSNNLHQVLKDALLQDLLDIENSNSEPTSINLTASKQDKPAGVFTPVAQSIVLASPQVRNDIKTGFALQAGSSKLILNKETVIFFFNSGNRWITKAAFAGVMANNKKVGLSKNTIQTYMCDMVKAGLLQDIEEAKGNTKSVRLNPALINEANK